VRRAAGCLGTRRRVLHAREHVCLGCPSTLLSLALCGFLCLFLDELGCSKVWWGAQFSHLAVFFLAITCAGWPTNRK